MTEEKKLKIMIVDDDRFLLDMYLLKFNASGFDVDPVSSTKEAFDKLHTGSIYDVILLDIIMPGMDGIELLEKIREEKYCPEASIIILTNQAEGEQKAKDLGVDGYIIKSTAIPSEVVEIVLKIQKANHKVQK